MKLLLKSMILLILIIGYSCTTQEKKEEIPMSSIDQATIEQTLVQLQEKFPDAEEIRIERGVNQVSIFWNENDGTNEEFTQFCLNNFAASGEDQKVLYEKLSRNFEIMFGYFHRMNRALKEPVQLDIGPLTPIDILIGSYNPSSHVFEDLFNNKFAFITLLNFPFYSLDEKNELGKTWSRQDWAYARMGDVFTSRIPPALLLKSAELSSAADNYIDNYNIMMGHLVDSEGNTYFREDMKLITHWGLRDEIKANYGQEGGLEKQKMVYQVMKRIIDQSIPEKVISNPDYQWNPYENKVFENGNEISFTSEPDTRYVHFLNGFLAQQELDPYTPYYSNYISRKFDSEMEISHKEIESLFTAYVSSPQVAKVAELIKERLGRDLHPYDIWYDGFKARSSFSPEMLDQLVNKKYPSKDAFEKDLPNILVKLGFSFDKAAEISSRIAVDASRGAGHAWGASMRGDKAHLRTRIGKEGMDYKGYNIAVHEFGHNVEQTITLYDVDYYMLRRVPNTAFTEAVAFIFQTKDMALLGLKDEDPNQQHLKNLDLFWGSYEIMGVSLVDMEVWKWLYANPEVTPAQLKEKVIEIAKDVWNKYYAPVFGMQDEPILAIYSHMISYPLYLSAYPLGHLIEFQMEDYIGNKNLAQEIHRMLVMGSITPQHWMKNAVGDNLSIEPMLKAVDFAVEELQ
jgi:hypothetical protein